MRLTELPLQLVLLPADTQKTPMKMRVWSPEPAAVLQRQS